MIQPLTLDHSEKYSWQDVFDKTNSNKQIQYFCNMYVVIFCILQVTRALGWALPVCSRILQTDSQHVCQSKTRDKLNLGVIADWYD